MSDNTLEAWVPETHMMSLLPAAPHFLSLSRVAADQPGTDTPKQESRIYR